MGELREGMRIRVTDLSVAAKENTPGIAPMIGNVYTVLRRRNGDFYIDTNVANGWNVFSARETSALDERMHYFCHWVEVSEERDWAEPDDLERAAEAILEGRRLWGC